MEARRGRGREFQIMGAVTENFSSTPLGFVLKADTTKRLRACYLRGLEVSGPVWHRRLDQRVVAAWEPMETPLRDSQVQEPGLATGDPGPGTPKLELELE